MKLSTQVSVSNQWEVAKAQIMRVLGDHARQINAPLSVVETADLPAANAGMDGTILVEDAGVGDRNLILYAGGERFRINGGSPF